MREILLTSSALILALLALRRLFRKTLSRRAQYALWGLVLLRLLVPVNLPAVDFSLLTAAEPVVSGAGGRSLYMEPHRVTLTAPEGETPFSYTDDPRIALGPSSEDNVYSFTNRNQVVHKVEYARQIALEDLFRAVWYGGMAVMGCWLVLSNLLFWLRLRRNRTPYPVEGTSRRVYLVERGLPSPCLFGLFRPAVYLTPAALQSPDCLRHVLAHEETHARHRDPLWSLLRGVCLTVYWFDPLVWWAALASRTDCELACDEGALRRLGEAERVPYGRTLLSLIPVRKTPANPLLSATTMTAGKRQLQDRITRIAENRTYLGRALFAAVALAALVCAVTFTGAKQAEPSSFEFDTVDQAVAAVAEELAAMEDPEYSLPVFVVYTPENPPEHFDLDGGELLRVYWYTYVMLSSNLSDPLGRLCSLYRLDPDADSIPANAELLGSDGRYQYALARVGWAPELKQGQTEGMSLLNRAAGRIREAVLSCASLNREAAPPGWEPLYTIPLDGLEPYEPQAAAELPFPYGSPKMLGGLEDPEHVLGDYGLMFFEGGPPASMGGEVFAGVQHLARSSFPTPFWSFRPGAGGKYSASLFRNLLGHDGFCITYHANDGPRTLTNEYYYLNEEGWPVLLARLEGYPQRVDLDGDGVDELASNSFGEDCLFFRRDGKLYRADLRPLLQSVWPTYADFYFETWDPAARSLAVSAWSGGPSYAAVQSRVSRALYFDGENLLVYNDQRNFDSHILNWPDLPAVVIDAALEEVQKAFEDAGEPYDGWRIVCLEGPRNLELAGVVFPVFRVRYEFHSPEPQYSQALDSRDSWVDPCYPEGLYLVFREDAPEPYVTKRVYQFAMRQNPWPSAEQLPQRLSQIPLGTGTLEAESAASAAALAQMVMDRLMEADTVNMNLLVPKGGGRCDADPRAGNGLSYATGFISDFDWSFAEDPEDMPATSLLLMSGDLSLRFWPDSSLVLLSTPQEVTWLRAEPNGNPEWVTTAGIFEAMRLWYDEAQMESLSAVAPIPDRGQSREEIVLAWADAFEGAKLNAAPGSQYACTYVRNQDIWFPDWLDELSPEELDRFYPAGTKGHERFAFAYSTVFVPENDKAAHYLMAGNTGPYEGGDAPAGAQVYSRCGFMYLTENGWHCDSIGTGW